MADAGSRNWECGRKAEAGRQMTDGGRRKKASDRVSDDIGIQNLVASLNVSIPSLRRTPDHVQGRRRSLGAIEMTGFQRLPGYDILRHKPQFTMTKFQPVSMNINDPVKRLLHNFVPRHAVPSFKELTPYCTQNIAIRLFTKLSILEFDIYLYFEVCHSGFGNSSPRIF
jgi:hypothetical protein